MKFDGVGSTDAPVMFRYHHQMRTAALVIVFIFFGLIPLFANNLSPVLLFPDSRTTVETIQGKDTSMDIFMDGVDALDMEDFDEAARLFKKASILDPQNLEHKYYLGVALSRLGKNHEALSIFESLTAEDPTLFFKAYFDMVAIYSREKKYAKAIETLKKAEKIYPESGRIFLDMGYAYKDSGNYSQALMCFSRAQALDPKLNQISVYMIGATHLAEEQFDLAAQKFKEAVELGPETSLGESARQTLPRVKEAARAHKPWNMTTSFNWGYDDNVARDPIEQASGGPVTGGKGRGDQYQSFLLKGGYKFLNLKNMEAGVGYSLFSIGYKDWTDSNVTSHCPHAYFQADWAPVFFRFQYDFSYFYSGGKKQGVNPPFYLTFAGNSKSRLRMHSFMPTISILEPYGLRSDITSGYQRKDYLDGITGDSSRFTAGITQSYRIPGTQTFPRIGYRTAYEKSDDDPSTYRYHELMAGISSAIYWDIWGDLSFAFMRTHYPDFSSGGDRLDTNYTTSFSLRRYFFEHLLVSFSYAHIKNDSDYLLNGWDLYLFRKNVYSVELTYVF